MGEQQKAVKIYKRSGQFTKLQIVSAKKNMLDKKVFVKFFIFVLSLGVQQKCTIPLLGS